jgi:hypothetical protein
MKMQIITAKDQWTPITKTISARIWDNKLWRKETGDQFYGGYQIKFCHIDSRIAREWLLQFGHTVASCNAEVADMIDPMGILRRSGLLFVN